MFKEKCEVLENRKVAPGHFILKLRSRKIGVSAKPGQFVQISCGDNALDPLLGRPFSFLTATSSDFSLLYHVVGKGTERMAKFEKGDAVPVLGPLGNGFLIEDGRWKKEDGRKKRILVGGGVGIPPLYHLAETLLRHKTSKKEDIHVFLGARTKTLLLCEKEFKKLGVHLSVATDDGSKGLKGFVISLLTHFLKSPISHLPSSIYTCGPTPMLKAVSNIASEFGVPNEVSVEVPMACGFGACLGCAIKVKGEAPGSHRFAIACCEGPVFEGNKILWE